MKKFSNSFVFCLFGLVWLLPAENMKCSHSGIRGTVYLVTGNQMPSPGEPKPAPRGIKTTLYIYELTNMSQVVRTETSAFYSTIASKPVKQVETGEDGSFKVKLPPGRYSLFVKKGELFYSNIFDGENNIHPVTVVKGEYAKDEFRVDYNAVY